MVVDVLLPVFLLVGIGWALGHWLNLDYTPIAKITFWCFSPALIFESLRTAALPAESAALVAAFVVAHYVGLFLMSIPIRRWLFPTDPRAQAAVSLTLVFGNCGNLGLPILLFTFGQAGIDVGAVFLATNSILLATVGVAIATWEGTFAPRRIARGVLEAPWLYAVAAAALARIIGSFPAWLARATGLLAQGAVPIFVLLLGIQLARVRPQEIAARAVVVAALRLILGGTLAWGLAGAFQVEGALRGSLIVEGSVPTAVNSFLLAVEYDRRPDLAAAALFLSTLFSAGTLSITLFFLAPGGGI